MTGTYNFVYLKVKTILESASLSAAAAEKTQYCVQLSQFYFAIN